MGHRAHLGHAVALQDPAAKAFGQPAAQFAVQGRRSGQCGVHRAEIVVGHHRVLCQGHGHRRGNEQVAAFVVLDDPQELGQLELRHRDQAGALAQGEVQQHGQSVDVEERQQCQQPVLRGDLEQPAGLLRVRHEVPVAEHHSLGPAGGPGGVRQHGHVGGGIEADVRRRGAGGQQVPQRGVAGGAVEHDEPVGRDPGPGGGFLGCGEQGRDGKQPLRAGVVELEGDLVRRVQGVDGGDGRAGPQQSVENHGEGRDIGAKDRRDAVDAQALRRDGSGDGVDLPHQRPVAGLRTAGAVDDGDPVQVRLLQAAKEVVVEADIGNFHIGERAGKHATSPLIRVRRAGGGWCHSSAAVPWTGMCRPKQGRR